MKSFEVLTSALEFIELNICEDISQEDIADYCAYSLSSLQKMFSRVFHIGIGDYINRRRISSASKDLLSTDSTILEIAMKYRYNSHEVFSRAFMRVWGETPSKYRKKYSFSEIYPKLDMPLQRFNSKGDIMKNTNRFDISELYGYLKDMDGTYVLSFDMVHLMNINNTYSHAAGDFAIAECLKRIDTEKSDEMIMFRIGADEFILLTGYKDMSNAEKIGENIMKHNGGLIEYNGNDIAVSMRFGIMKLESRKKLQYSELFTKLVEVSRPK